MASETVYAIRSLLSRKELKKLSRAHNLSGNLAKRGARDIKSFTHVAKKYHVDFALKKDTTAEQSRYLVFFKSRDADAITAAFQEFTAGKLHRKPSIRKILPQAKEQAQKTEHRQRDREKEIVKERGVEL